MTVVSSWSNLKSWVWRWEWKKILEREAGILTAEWKVNMMFGPGRAATLVHLLIEECALVLPFLINLLSSQIFIMIYSIAFWWGLTNKRKEEKKKTTKDFVDYIDAILCGWPCLFSFISIYKFLSCKSFVLLRATLGCCQDFHVSWRSLWIDVYVNVCELFYLQLLNLRDSRGLCSITVLPWLISTMESLFWISQSLKFVNPTVNYSKHFPETGINLPPSLSHSNAFLNCRKVQTSFNKNILFRSVRIPLQLIPWLKTQGHISKAPCGALIMAGHQVPTTPLSPPCPHRGRKCNGEAHGLR